MSFNIDLLRHGLPWVVVCLLTGCGDSGRHVSGKVTFNGKPVPAGTIYLIPDSSKGNEGPTGYATIQNGEYDTADDGKGVGGGPVIVGIEGFNPEAMAEPEEGDTSGEETVQSLFPYYETTAEIPDDAELNVDVPLAAVKRTDSPETPYINP
jgi:hypothetical protein